MDEELQQFKNALGQLREAVEDIQIRFDSHRHSGTDMSKPLFPIDREVAIQVFAPGTALTTGDGKAFFRVGALMGGYLLVAVAAAVTTASSSGALSIQIRNASLGADMLSTALTIDANETDSSTAATPAVISSGNARVTEGDQIYIDVDAAGTGTAGLFIVLRFKKAA